MTTLQKTTLPFILVFFEMATYLSNDMYLPALPSMMHELSISYHQAQMVLTSWFLGSISVQLFLGPLSDRFGRKSVLCIGVILFIMSSILCAITNDIDTLCIARFVQGTGICFMSVPGYASIHESFEQKDAIRLLALMASIAILAPAFGPLLGSLVLWKFNWRWIFGFLVIWSSIAAILLITLMPETLPPNKRHSLELRPLLNRYANIMTNKLFLTTITTLGLLFCSLITWIAAGPFILIDQFHYSPIVFGIVQAIIFMCTILSNHLVKYVMEWIGIQRMIRYGLSIAFVGGTIILIAALISPHHLLGIIIGLTFVYFGSGFAFAPLNRLTIEASNEPMGARMAIFSMLLSSFATLASILVNIFYHQTLISFALMIFVLILLAIVFNNVRLQQQS